LPPRPFSTDLPHGGEPRTLGPADLDLDELYRAHAAALSRFIVRLAGRTEAPDLLHETFLVAARRLGSFRGDGSPLAWLYGIAARVVARRGRKRRLQRLLGLVDQPALDREPVDPETPEVVLQQRRAAARIDAVLARLGERDRVLILLFELEGLAARDIARVVGASENAVWVGLHRARARFRDAYLSLFPGEGLGDA
jgi:RNA polymerase sigma-70 factor (ECF subfamily)